MGDRGLVKSSNLEYRPAANLVIQASVRDRGRTNEPSGEAESLKDHLAGTRMGDRVGRSKPAELEEMLEKARKKRERAAAEAEADAAAFGGAKRSRKDGGGAPRNFLSELEKIEGVSYRPKTKESRAVYEQVLTFMQKCLGDQPQEVLAGAAEEVLAILKDDALREPAKKARAEELLGRIPDDSFARLVNLGKAINDFSLGGSGSEAAGGAAPSGGMDEDMGVAVVFEDDEEEAEEIRDEIIDEEEGGAGGGAGGPLDDDEDEGEDVEVGAGLAAADAAASASSSSTAAADDAEEEAAGLVPVHKLDAFWLQRELNKSTPDNADATAAQALAAEVLAVLGASLGPGRTCDLREAENRLVALLDFDRFDLIKTLLRNAPRVYYLTRLRQAQTDGEREEVRSLMAADSESGGASLLASLDRQATSSSWAQDRASAVTKRVRQEARQLAAAAAATGGSGAGGGGGAGIFAADVDTEEFSSGGAASVVPGARSLGAPGTSSVASSSASSGASGAALPAIPAAAASAAAAAAAPGEAPQRTLDLESLSFSAGGHLMSNRRVELPDKSWRAQKKGYEEVHIPALKAKPFAPGEVEVPIGELPEWAQAAFKGMTKLNRVQSALYRTALFSPENMLLCAPTGAGKTNVAVLSILHEIGSARRPDGSIDVASFKVVYVAPMKALVQEVVANLSQRLGGPYGLTVRELSGDVSLSRAELAETQIIVTTPEKWDVITRKPGEARAFTQLVRLVILDEVHLLHDERGPVLEALVARTLRQVETTQEMVRLVGLSATLPNYEDVATFLRVKPETGLFHFDSSYRPCPLQQCYIGITEKKAIRKHALMNEITYEKVAEQAGRNQVLVFVHSRKETVKTARALRDLAVAKDALGTFLREDSASREILVTEAEASVKDAGLKELLPYGFAVHHAGMARSDRTLVEELFADGHVQVLVSTATLAWGVNLPAHAVVIKGTQVYSPEKGRWTELSPLDVMQMLGRAGRPQYDTFGEGIIVTGHGELQFYLSLLNQQLPIESQMVGKLPDNLNAEVCLGTISNVREAANWLGYTYLYVRMLRNPALYGVTPEERESDPLLLQRRLDLAHTAAVLLDLHNLIRYDKRSGAFQPTALGRVASHYYVSHATIATYNEYLRPSLGDIELLRLFSLSGEFKNVVVRQEEKEELRKLLERVPIPVKESVEEPSAKVNVLLQAYVSGLGLEGLALASDMVYVHQSAGRLVRAMFEICLRRGWAALAQRTLTLAKMIDHRQWQSASPLRQFSSPRGLSVTGGASAALALPEDVLRKLERKDIGWDRFYDLKPADLGELVRLPKLGKAVHRLIHALPRLELSAAVQPITRSLLRVDLTITPDFAFDPKLHGPSESFWVTVEDCDGEAILHSESWSLKARFGEEPHTLTLYVPLTDPTPPHYLLRVSSDRWLHSEALLALPFRHLALPDKFPPPTELLDLAPLPITALKDPEAQALYAGGANGSGGISHFNPIQTQAFAALYEGDGNVLIAAPSGAGKTLCAELALLRLFRRDPDARAVYVAPREETASLRFSEWELRFGQGLGKAVVELTGELAADLKLLERAHIVIATPRTWDIVSRRWKKRLAVASVGLFIADDLEALGETPGSGAGGAAGAGGDAAASAGGVGVGPTYEVVVSRMRFIGLQQREAGGAPVRLLGLATSLANARDVGDWLGAGPAGTFGFHPQVRPVPLEIRIQGFDVPHAGARLVAMARPAYAACAQYASPPPTAAAPSPTASSSPAPKPALVFVPSRKQAALTAIDIMTFAAADGQPDRFLRGRGVSSSQVADAAARAGVKDGALLAVLGAGVGMFHEGMRPAERSLVERLFAGGHLGVVVATASSSWGMSGASWGAGAVVIMGTESYDGRAHAYVDYPLPLLLHLMGRAGRPGTDDTGRVVLLCAGSRKEYLKKFLYEPLPLESGLGAGRALADHLCAEVVNGVVESKQDALDYLTWTLLYRRLPANPAFYGLGGTSHRHLSDFLSELVDASVSDLEAARCIAVDEDGVGLTALNLGMIASYYYVACTTLEVFAASLGPKTKTRGLLEIVSNASEFGGLPLRHGEDKVLRSTAAHLPLALPPPPASGSGRAAASQYHDPHTKAFILLQSHFSRSLGSLPPETRSDASRLLPDTLNLLYALVDVVASEGHLKPALAAMELAQMTVQGLWASTDSPLRQVPHVGPELAGLLASPPLEGVEPVESVFDLLGLEPGVRSQLLSSLSPPQLGDVARFCNRYPNIDVAYQLAVPSPDGSGGVETVSPADDEDAAPSVPGGESVGVRVTLTREAGSEGMDEGAGLGAVHAPLYPKPKAEGWWLVVGEPSANAIHAIKRVTVGTAPSTVKLDFPAPTAPGKHELTLFFMCDAYLGCDQEYAFTLDVLPAEEGGAGGAMVEDA